jgi:hypothetical protein
MDTAGTRTYPAQMTMTSTSGNSDFGQRHPNLPAGDMRMPLTGRPPFRKTPIIPLVVESGPIHAWAQAHEVCRAVGLWVQTPANPKGEVIDFREPIYAAPGDWVHYPLPDVIASPDKVQCAFLVEALVEPPQTWPTSGSELREALFRLKETMQAQSAIRRTVQRAMTHRKHDLEKFGEAIIQPNSSYILQRSAHDAVGSCITGVELHVRNCCGTCDATGILGPKDKPEFQIKCSACDGTTFEKSERPPVTIVVNDIGVGKDRTMFGEPLLHESLGRGMIRTTRISAPLIMSISLSNKGNQPASVGGFYWLIDD